MKINCAKNPLICAIIPFIFGIVSGQYILSLKITLIISIFSLSLYLIFKTREIATFFLLMTLFFAGMLRYQQSVELLPAKHLNGLKSKQIKSIIGTISNSRYSANERHQYTLSCDSVFMNKKWMLARGEILLKTKKIKQKYSYGMCIKIKGQLSSPPNERNPGQFNYRQYLAQNDINWIIQISSADSAVILQMKHLNRCQAG